MGERDRGISDSGHEKTDRRIKGKRPCAARKNKKKKETVKFCEIEQNGKTRLIPESRPRTWAGSRERRRIGGLKWRRKSRLREWRSS